jgi:hypothetical protein
VAGKGHELGVEGDLAGLDVVAADEPAVIVDRISVITPPKCRNVLSRPSNQISWRSFRKARTCIRREKPSVATNRNTFVGTPPIKIRRSPKSICS